MKQKIFYSLVFFAVNTVSTLGKSDSFFFYKTHVPLERNKFHEKLSGHFSEVRFILFKPISFGLINIDASWKRLQKSNHPLGA
jgi:hypothetical protein